MPARNNANMPKWAIVAVVVVVAALVTAATVWAMTGSKEGYNYYDTPCFRHYGAVTDVKDGRSHGPAFRPSRYIEFATRHHKTGKNTAIYMILDTETSKNEPIYSAPMGSLWQLHVQESGKGRYSAGYPQVCAPANTSVNMGANCMQLTDNAACHFYPNNKYYVKEKPYDFWRYWTPEPLYTEGPKMSR